MDVNKCDYRNGLPCIDCGGGISEENLSKLIDQSVSKALNE